jgi:hypothetical protein
VRSPRECFGCAFFGQAIEFVADFTSKKEKGKQLRHEQYSRDHSKNIEHHMMFPAYHRMIAEIL